MCAQTHPVHPRTGRRTRAQQRRAVGRAPQPRSHQPRPSRPTAGVGSHGPGQMGGRLRHQSPTSHVRRPRAYRAN
jgi:hypothetical protein